MIVKDEYYAKVPKNYHENLKFRARLIKQGCESKEAAQAIWMACARSLLFYVNFAVWTYDTRTKAKVLPFITYDFQDEAFMQLDAAIGDHDLAFEKSRDMGASWMLLTAFEWHWHFRHDESLLLVSRNEDYVDKPGNPKSLFWKIDFIHKHLPAFLMPRITRTKMRLTNEDNGSVIDGESTTGDIARGDRRLAIGLDEFAAVEIDDGYRALDSTQYATPCRIFNSTYQGHGNAFYEMIAKKQTQVLRLHWTQHPEKAKGLYYDEYGKARSPYYDKECLRALHPSKIAQELDCDAAASDSQFFPAELMKRIETEHVRDPFMIGELAFDTITMKPTAFVPHEKGRLKLWLIPDDTGRPPIDHKFGVGADIAAGTGSSNSVLSVGNKNTGEKVAEFVSANITPHDLGDYATALCRWFNDAYLVAEANGGGGMNFIGRVIDNGYNHVYHRTNEKSIVQKQTMVPGWWASKDTKAALFGDYRRALSTDQYINRSECAVREHREIVYTANGAVRHSKADHGLDPSATKDNHGDMPTADALSWKAMSDVPMSERVEAEEIPPGSFAWRREYRRQAALAGASW